MGQFGLVFMYILFQAALNVYMKYIMSGIPVAPGLDLFGLPASFLITGLQQLVALCLFCVFLRLGRFVGSATPNRSSAKQRLCIIALAVAFSLNMGLNNLSFAFIPLSVNQVIRACMPLATAILQALMRGRHDVSATEWTCMIVGVLCAIATVVARTEGQLAASSDFLFGALLCVGSVFCGAADLVMKQMVGTELKLSPLKAMGSMALPSFLFLLVPGFLLQHRVSDSWAAELQSNTGWTTDADVLWRGASLNAGILAWIVGSGVLAFGYNIFTTYFTVKLSATTASLVGNFPTSTLVSLLLLERTGPSGLWSVLLWASVSGNVASFAAYNFFRRRRFAKENR